MAKLVPYNPPAKQENRQPGRLKGQIIISDDFAATQDLTIVTSDSVFQKYDVPILS